MSMIATHAAALSSQVSAYHEFLARYSKSSKTVYGFVEGKGDPVFYKGFIEQYLPEDWSLELWSAGSKDRVYQVHSCFDWRRFRKQRICFFVDRDLSDLVPDRSHADSNIYVTDNYAIENDVVNSGVCRRVLTELFGLSTVPHAELDSVCGIFERELERFHLEMLPVMAWILSWRRRKIKAYLSEIIMSDLFTFRAGVLQAIVAPKGKADVTEYIHSKCKVALDLTIDIAAILRDLRIDSKYRRFTRGKYVFWFLVEFCRSVHASATTLFPSCNSTPTIRVTVSDSNGMYVIGNRSRMPTSLRSFVDSNFIAYIQIVTR